MTADEFVHNLVVRVFFAFSLAATGFVIVLALHLYFGWFSTMPILIFAAVVFLVGVLIGPDRAEKILDWFKLMFWMAG